MTVDRMMRTVAKAYLAVGQADAVSKLRSLSFLQLEKEFEWAIVALDTRNLLTLDEQKAAEEHQLEWLERAFA